MPFYLLPNNHNLCNFCKNDNNPIMEMFAIIPIITIMPIMTTSAGVRELLLGRQQWHRLHRWRDWWVHSTLIIWWCYKSWLWMYKSERYNDRQRRVPGPVWPRLGWCARPSPETSNPSPAPAGARTFVCSLKSRADGDDAIFHDDVVWGAEPDAFLVRWQSCTEVGGRWGHPARHFYLQLSSRNHPIQLS